MVHTRLGTSHTRLGMNHTRLGKLDLVQVRTDLVWIMPDLVWVRPDLVQVMPDFSLTGVIPDISFLIYYAPFVWFDSLRPIQQFFSYAGRIFLGWTSTKQGIMCLAQGHNAVHPVRLEPATPWFGDKHSTTEPLRSLLCNYVGNPERCCRVKAI